MGFFHSEVTKGAVLSACKRYRYLLTRTWDSTAKQLIFCGLNPSTADAEEDDATIRWLLGYARLNGYGGIIVVNLFAWRATQPKDMLAARHPIQVKGTTDNDLAILQLTVVRHSTFLCGWGSNGTYLQRDRVLMNLLDRKGMQPYALLVNKDGTPHHPLRVSHKQMLLEYKLP